MRQGAVDDVHVEYAVTSVEAVNVLTFTIFVDADVAFIVSRFVA